VLFFLISWSELSVHEHPPVQLKRLLMRLWQERPKRFVIADYDRRVFEEFYIDIIKVDYPEVAATLACTISSPPETEVTDVEEEVMNEERYRRLTLGPRAFLVFLAEIPPQGMEWILKHLAKTGDGIWHW
jgi:hypothetical protein